MAQGLVLVLLGAAALSTTLGAELYLNYVKEYFRPFLAASGIILLALGIGTVVAELRSGRRADDATQPPRESTPTAAVTQEAGSAHQPEADSSCHEHGHGTPRVAWLMVLPAAAIFVVSPPALGAYSVGESGSAPDPEDVSVGGLEFPDDPDQPMELDVQEFVMHAWVDEERHLAGQLVRLTGFVAPVEEDDDAPGDGWYLARLQMACCAADAVVNKVLITNEPAPEVDSWVTVEGRWVEPEGDQSEVRTHELEVEDLTPVDDPPDPYE
ncbi:TIGR03943 family putative permease subunit [Lipingzhangella rawalii]|nr:TIGR03943 family protein [Lipingzhangella rawalii]